MNVIRITDTGIVEPCPSAGLEGFHPPTQEQADRLLARGGDGRLISSLLNDSILTWGDPIATLAASALFRLLELGEAEAPVGFGGLGNPDVSLAIADLAVSGSNGQAAFRSAATLGAGVDVPGLRREVTATLLPTAERLGVTLSRSSLDAIPDAVDHAVDRALAVLWALHGPTVHRVAARPALGWIAMDSEKDPPCRPVNVPAAPWPTADLEVRVLHAGRFHNIRLRYAIAGGIEGSEVVALHDGLPDAAALPWVPEDALVVVFLHGHSSRLEEGVAFYENALRRDEGSCFRRPLVMIALDFPSNGYSQNLDPESLSPLESTTRFVPDRPGERRFGMLELYERLVVRFMSTLNDRLVAAGRPEILSRIGAVIGGSMGGNLALRLSAKLVTFAPWLDALVSWSPASVYGSFGRADYLIPSPGEHVDPIAKEALERVLRRYQDGENSSSRSEYIRLQMQGERVINDGTPEFEAATRFLAFFLQPIVGGLAPILIPAPFGHLVSGLVGPAIFGSVALEGAANYVAVKQSDEWLRPECREAFDSAAAAQGALYFLHETYNNNRRRTHWRIAYEQLLFSHQDEVADSRGLPCYEASEIPTLLIAGEDDVVDEGRFNIYGGVETIAPDMVNNEGYCYLVANTGHSIHAERPEWLSQKIHEFLCIRRPPREVVAVHRDGGRITDLEFGGIWRPVPVERAIAQGVSAGGLTPYHIRNSDGSHNRIFARRFLASSPDEITENNLRALPATSLPEPEDPVPGPAEGFEVTHIRVRPGDPARPWTSWVTHLCNDALGLQVSNYLAEEGVRRGEARYFIRHAGVSRDLVLVEYLTTTPDDSVENNLSSLPDA